jgi:hypothetical protein
MNDITISNTRAKNSTHSVSLAAPHHISSNVSSTNTHHVSLAADTSTNKNNISQLMWAQF